MNTESNKIAPKPGARRGDAHVRCGDDAGVRCGDDVRVRHDDARVRRDGAGVRRGDARRWRVVLLGAIIFAVAFGVRALSRQDARLEGAKVQSSVAADYRRVARLLAEGGASSFFRRASPLADPDTLGHPPGYSILLALSYKLFGQSGDARVQLFQIACDALSAVVLFLVVAELLGLAPAAVAGFMSALSPQFSWNSVTPLPDTLAVLPVLLAVYCVALATREPVPGDDGERRRTLALPGERRRSLILVGERRRSLVLLLATGALVGLSCWLRANALLLAPLLAAACALMFARELRARAAVALLCGAMAVVAPLTIRNAFVFRRFIPLSLGAGQTLLEGIGDYDRAGRFGIPRTDLAILRMEAAESGRPDYADTLFGPDGVARERERTARAFRVVRSHPLWFAGVMARRGASMLKLERARLVSAEPPVTHALDAATQPALDATQSRFDAATQSAEASRSVEATQSGGARGAVWSGGARELLAGGIVLSPGAKAALDAGESANGADEGAKGAGDDPALRVEGDDSVLRLEGDGSKYGDQFAAEPFAVAAATDYLLSVRVKTLRGRARLCVLGGDGAEVLNSTLAEELEGRTAKEQPWQTVALPFVARGAGAARLVIRNEGPSPALLVSGARLDALGPASGLWTRYPRLLVRAAQKVFITAVVLPLAAAGLLLLALARRRRALFLLLVVPAYYACFQSMLHTEYRYVLALYHFMFALAALALTTAAARVLRRRPARETETSAAAH